MVKLILPCLIYIITITSAISQNYKSIEWDVLGVKHIIPTEKNIGNATGLFTEVRINLNDEFSVGLKSEWHFFGDYFEEPLRGAGISTSLAITADHYVFNKLNSRAFLGATFGTFNNSGITESGINVGSLGIGITPRFGYEFEFLRIAGEYNHTFKQDFPNFVAIGLGLNIGGRFK